MRRLLFLALVLATPATGQTLQQRVETTLDEAATGTRFGLVVTDADGAEIVAVNPDGRFIPASNTKMFTTAAAFATVPGLDQPDVAGGTAVRIEGSNVILEGHGDARLSSADDCAVDCLATLADAVAAKTRHVRDVIGDDTLFPDQRWSPGMSWNNIPSRSGTGISALSLDDNELVIRVTPTVPGEVPTIDALGYYQIENRALTTAAGATALGYDRDPNRRVLKISGTIAVGAPAGTLRVGIDDPADYAAWRFKALLEARGVRVRGTASARHRALAPGDDPAVRKGAPPARPPVQEALARLTPPPLAENIVTINKVSQNLHAELLLRRVGLQHGTGSIADGQAQVQAMLEQAGVPRTAYDLSDGSGMSSYNRAAPRGTVTMLRWIAEQPWGSTWRASLPIGGVDGTLSRRFKGTVLEGKIFAKTGTLNATNALSGYMIAKSGKELTFSSFANDIPADAGATKFVDAALVLIAEAN
ncbi:D-alanyl-D-alanine carboxypeptidase/D-alanyl-D-alanine endopeptidase [Sphingomonas sp. M1-B02]|uniref:D-alanyl-D-alanine carboxypeptidase/D-alanyl-D-alanine endopeptidase n=1 Tax=Sphingomonas sp. M1-B02 TaxID=3114300 RepID=UPI00224059ED|nr:D-alanyl-D-alanine carboxypeptidase/D-alanyl-D-alanine-endopeptidase [Sphingomonas sp. S6-11]UZK65954.1 D-alanyl-D-alanine carboxypeptidase/D-alanyl-D-alanine-endopeptidase [Sphingomonas sp. S6-11]